MTERETLVREIYAEAIAAGLSAKWTVVSVLDTLDRAGYEVVRKRPPMPITALSHAEVQAMCDAAARKGAALALRTVAGCEATLPHLHRQLSEAADRIERGET